jgi:AraC-like DNA-binding protein
MDEFRFFALDKSGRFSIDSGGKKNKLLAGRMNRIQDYLYDNYFKKVTLQDIAEREHLSIYYLSHVIKDATGLSYKEFLNYIRVEESEKLLLGTDMKVSAISEAVGFSATRYFVKYFKLWFGMEPRDYRAQHPGQVSDRGVAAQVTPIEPKAIREAVRKLSNEIYRKYAALPPSETKVIAVDARVNVPFQPVNHPPNTPTLSRRLNNTDRARHSKLLWDMFRKIEGQIAAEGEDYILKIENDGGNARAAILVSNPADRFAVKEEQPAQRVVIAASRSGSYEVVRIKHTRRNMDAAEARRSALTTGREDVINTIMAFPEVKREEMIAIASLVFEVVLEPDESELILLDEG